MPGPNIITVSQLMRLVGTPESPAIVDVRVPDDVASDPRILPGATALGFSAVASWAANFAGRSVAVVCQRGLKLSQGVTAWLRHEGVAAESLEGGFEAWAQAGGPLISPDHLPARDTAGRTLWVTRARPKVDRVACPWLIRRFVDPHAVFLFVAPSEVRAVADRFGATPFDVEETFWSHRGELCTFDVMLDAFGLRTDPLLHLARIVRGADTARPELAPESAGLLAASLGLSRMHRDDLAQLEAAMGLYDAFYRWARDATGETHDWPGRGGARA